MMREKIQPHLTRGITLLKQKAAVSVARTLTGTITVLGLMLILPPSSEQAWQDLGLIWGTLFALILTRFFSEGLQQEIQLQRPLSFAEKKELMRSLSPMFFPGLVPAVLLVFYQLNWLSLDAAIVICRWTMVGIIFAFAVLARQLAGFGTFSSIMIGLIYTAVGIALVVLKHVLF